MTPSVTDTHAAPVDCPQDTACASPQYPLEGGATGSAVKNPDDPRRLASDDRRTPMLVRANASVLSRKLHPIPGADKGHVSNPCSVNCKREHEHDEGTAPDNTLYPKKVAKTPRASLWLIHAKRSKKSSRRLAGLGTGSSFPAQNNVNGSGDGNGNSPRDTADGSPKIIAEGSSGSADGNGPDGNANANQNSPSGTANGSSNGNGKPSNGDRNGNGDGNENSNGSSTPGGGGTGTSGGNPGAGATGTPEGDGTRTSSSAPGSGATVTSGGGGTETSSSNAPTGISGSGTPSGDSNGSRSPSGTSSSFGNNFAVSGIRTAPNNGNPSPTHSSGGSSGNDNKPESTSGGQIKSNGQTGNAGATNQRADSPTPTRAIVTAPHRTGFNKGHSSPNGGWTTISSVSSFTSTGMTTMIFTSGSSLFTTTMSTTMTGVTTISIATDLPEQTSQHHSNAGTIAGALLGSIFGLLLILSLILCYRFKRRKQKKVGFLYLTPGPDTNFTDRLHVNTSPNTKSNLAKRNISSPVVIGHGVPSAGKPAHEPLSRQNIEIRVMKEVQKRSSMSPPYSRRKKSVPATDTGMSQPDLIWFPTETPTIEDPFDDSFQIQPSSTTATR